jgi:HD-GYP domain-containing protein (c-di-GMP phosphodiesterase class II)
MSGLQSDLLRGLDSAGSFLPDRLNPDQLPAFQFMREAMEPDSRKLGELLAEEQISLAYRALSRHVNQFIESPRPEHVKQSVDLMQTVFNSSRDNDELIGSLLNARRANYSLADHMAVVGLLMLQAAAVVEDDPEVWPVLAGGAMLADLGKAGVDEATLLKEGRLPPEEWKPFFDHPCIAAAWLTKAGADKRIALMTAQHHEHLDGSGYPFRLHDDEIHRWSRLCAIVDAFASLTAGRPFRKPLSPQRAVWLIQAELGSRFDPDLFAAWLPIVLSTPGQAGAGSVGRAPKSPAPLDAYQPLPWVVMLPDEQVEHGGPSARTAERRRFARFATHLWCRVQVQHPTSVEQALSIWVRINELSRGGISFAYPSRLGTGQALWIHIPGQSIHRGRTLKAIVLHSRRSPSNLNVIGAKFDG